MLLALVPEGAYLRVAARYSAVREGNAVENVFIGASNELGASESGTLAAFVGIVPAVVLGGAATLGVVALGAVVFPQLRRFDRFAALAV